MLLLQAERLVGRIATHLKQHNLVAALPEHRPRHIERVGWALGHPAVALHGSHTPQMSGIVLDIFAKHVIQLGSFCYSLVRLGRNLLYK